MKKQLTRLFMLLSPLTLALSASWTLPARAADAVQLTVTDGAYTIPSDSLAVLTMKSTADYDVKCNVKAIGIIKGRDPRSGSELTARQSSDAVISFVLRAGRFHERRFNFVKAVQQMRSVWSDPQAVLVEVDSASVTADCQRFSDNPQPEICSWRGAQVQIGQWLESPGSKYRFCQCQANGSWGNCSNNAPSAGACDWSNPDWTNPACVDGGSKPCDWSNPDWSNPACNS